MPTRLLREGILDSERVNRLNAAEEVFYRRLMSKVDDHGFYDARSSILRASLFPLKLSTVSENDCEQWLTAVINAGLVVLYDISHKPLIKMLDTKWIARSKPKYALPENGCKQLKAPVTLDVVVVVVRSRLIEVVDVVVSEPVDNFPKPQVRAKVNPDLDTVQTTLSNRELYDWAIIRGLKPVDNEGAKEYKARIEAEYHKKTDQSVG